jgi:hypothetical protein
MIKWLKLRKYKYIVDRGAILGKKQLEIDEIK